MHAVSGLSSSPGATPQPSTAHIPPPASDAVPPASSFTPFVIPHARRPVARRTVPDYENCVTDIPRLLCGESRKRPTWSGKTLFQLVAVVTAVSFSSALCTNPGGWGLSGVLQLLLRRPVPIEAIVAARRPSGLGPCRGHRCTTCLRGHTQAVYVCFWPRCSGSGPDRMLRAGT